MPDVGYILGHQDEYEELRYSLRSVVRFLPDLGDVFIAGAPPPEWSTGLRHIPVDQLRTDNRREPGNRWWANRKTNMRTNLLALIDSPEVSDEFLYMNDDFLLVKPFSRANPFPYLGSFVETHRHRIGHMEGPYPDIYEWFQANGVSDPLHFSEHVPILVDGRLGDWMRQVWHIVGHPYASLWGNLADVRTVRGGPEFRDGDWILRHRNTHSETWPAEWWSVSTVSYSFHDWPVGEKIRAMFPNPSPYERDG